MKKITLSMLFLFIAFSVINAQKVVDKVFKAKKTVDISTVSGNCIIQKGNADEIKVHLTYTYDDDCFSIKLNEKLNVLEIYEEFKGSCSGKSEWVITVPENTIIEFNSASGDVEIADVVKGVDVNTASGDIKLSNVKGKIILNSASGAIELNKLHSQLKLNTASGNVRGENIDGEIDINTASGDVKLINTKGELDINTASGEIESKNLNGKITLNSASGDIELENAKGKFSVNSASGNIESENIIIGSRSSFTTASGDVKLELSESSAYDLTLSTASGNITLDYNGNKLNGFYEFTARVKKGKIISPVKFDKEEVIEKNGKKYDVKSFTKGSASPKITLKTYSGIARLIK